MMNKTDSNLPRCSPNYGLVLTRAGWATNDQEMILSLQFAMTLAPGEKRTISMVNGLAQNAENLRKHAWDKGHFICGFNDWGEKVGAHENREAQLFLNMQTWGVLSGAAADGPALMDWVERELSCPWGYVLNKPCYTKGDDHIGRVSYFEKGCYENGSVYNHGGTFKIAADCSLGRGEYAYQTVKRMLPANPENTAEHSGVEPYVITNMYLGPENNLRSGESLMGWITGAAVWLFRCITEFMLGTQADYDGLAIRPCLPGVRNEAMKNNGMCGGVYGLAFIGAAVGLWQKVQDLRY